MENFSFELVDKARETIDGRVIRTPVLPLCSSKIAPYLPPDCEMFMKLELFQHTGSFKARGALLGVDWLDEARRSRGVAGFSGGNCALALAWAARQSGVSAKVVMSKTADPLRIEGCRELGAEIVLVDGIALTTALHLLVAVLRVTVESAAVYPAAMACRPAVALSLIVFAAALATARRLRCGLRGGCHPG